MTESPGARTREPVLTLLDDGYLTDLRTAAAGAIAALAPWPCRTAPPPPSSGPVDRPATRSWASCTCAGHTVSSLLGDDSRAAT